MRRNALLIVAALCAAVVSVHGAPPHSNRRRLASPDRARVAIAEQEYAEGEARSKQAAEMAAAEATLDDPRLHDESTDRESDA